MARGGMRISEVLKFMLNDIHGRKLVLRDPKSGKDHEIVFIPPEVTDRLRNYANQKCKNPDDRVFRISYQEADHRIFLQLFILKQLDKMDLYTYSLA